MVEAFAIVYRAGWTRGKFGWTCFLWDLGPKTVRQGGFKPRPEGVPGTVRDILDFTTMYAVELKGGKRMADRDNLYRRVAAHRVRAPEFPEHLEWIGVEGPLSLAQLRGRVVLLHFWTYC